jgi:hypothetical protein
MIVTLAIQESEIRTTVVRSQPGQTVLETLSSKCPIQTRAGGMAQVVEWLSSKYEIMSSNPSMAKKKHMKLLLTKCLISVY